MNHRQLFEDQIATHMRETTRKLNGIEIDPEHEAIEKRHKEIFDMCYRIVDRDPRHNWSEIYARGNWAKSVGSIVKSYPELLEKYFDEIIEAVIAKILSREKERKMPIREVEARQREGVSSFLEDCCRDSPEDSVMLRVLYDAYSLWCDYRRIAIVTSSTFAQVLRTIYSGHPTIFLRREKNNKERVAGLLLIMSRCK